MRLRRTQIPLVAIIAAYVALSLAVVLMGGCASVEGYAKSFADGYCTADPEKRRIIRAAVNSAVAPTRMQVYCAGDAPPLCECLTDDDE